MSLNLASSHTVQPESPSHRASERQQRGPASGSVDFQELLSEAQTTKPDPRRESQEAVRADYEKRKMDREESAHVSDHLKTRKKEKVNANKPHTKNGTSSSSIATIPISAPASELRVPTEADAPVVGSEDASYDPQIKVDKTVARDSGKDADIRVQLDQAGQERGPALKETKDPEGTRLETSLGQRRENETTTAKPTTSDTQTASKAVKAQDLKGQNSQQAPPVSPEKDKMANDEAIEGSSVRGESPNTKAYGSLRPLTKATEAQNEQTGSDAETKETISPSQNEGVSFPILTNEVKAETLDSRLQRVQGSEEKIQHSEPPKLKTVEGSLSSNTAENPLGSSKDVDVASGDKDAMSSPGDKRPVLTRIAEKPSTAHLKNESEKGSEPMAADTKLAPQAAFVSDAKSPNLKSVDASPEVHPSPMQGSGIIDTLVQSAKVLLREGNSQIKITLKPEQLGALHLNATMKGDRLTASIFAESSAVRDFLENNLHLLQNALAQQGLKVDRIDILPQESLLANLFNGDTRSSDREPPHAPLHKKVSPATAHQEISISGWSDPSVRYGSDGHIDLIV